MLTMVGMASDPISRGMGAVVIRVYLSMCLCFITVFSWIAGANLVNLADGGQKKGRKRLALSGERRIFAKMEDKRKTNKQVMLGELGKYCIDISKLVFGGVVLAGIMKLDVNRALLFGLGTVVVLLTVSAGLICILLANSNKEK